MPEIRKADQFGNRIMIRALIATLVGMAGGVTVMFRLWSQIGQPLVIDSWTIGGGAIFFGVMCIFIYWTFRPGRYECPECGSQIVKPTAYVGPLQYHCPNCDILWDTGVKQWSTGG